MSLDILVATTLAQAAHASSECIGSRGAGGGQEFEREIFRALEGRYPWEHLAGPDHFDMALDLVGRTGTHYEFDGAFLSHGTLYVLEAKLVRVLNRQHVGIFVHKLVDILLATREHFSGLAIKPILVSGGRRISDAAWLHATSWGVLLVSPQRPTPQEILAHLESLPATSAVAELRADCELLAQRLWRPIDRLIFPSKPGSHLYTVATDQILDRAVCQQLLDFWDQCVSHAPASISSTP